MHRSRARWPTRSVDHPTDTALSSRYRAGGRAKSDTLHERGAVGAFPAADTACTAAALGGQRGVLTTLPIPRCPAATETEDGQLRCTNRRAGSFQQPCKFHQPRKSPPDGGLVRREIAYCCGGSRVISTRRFSWRPAAVLLSAIGWFGPAP